MQILNEKHEEGLEPFLGDFIIKRVQELDALKAALEINDFKLLVDHAHNWKGFSRPYGFIKLEELAVALEQSAKSEGRAICHQILQEITDYLELKKKAILLTVS